MEQQYIQALTATYEGHAIADHITDVGKMVELGSGSQREIDEVMRTPYA